MATVVITLFVIIRIQFKMDAEFENKQRDHISRREKRWSMNSQRLEEIVAELMKPISDLRRSFDTDLSALLEEYLTEAGLRALEEGEVLSEDVIQVSPNFSEVALLLQQSACIYGRKVDFLYQHVLNVSDSLHNSTQESASSNPDEPQTPSSHRRKRKHSVHENFTNIELESCSSSRREVELLKPPPTLPRMYIELEPRVLTSSDIPLMDYVGESIGLLSDYHVTWRLQNGMLIDELQCVDNESTTSHLKPISEAQAALSASPTPLPSTTSSPLPITTPPPLLEPSTNSPLNEPSPLHESTAVECLTDDDCTEESLLNPSEYLDCVISSGISTPVRPCSSSTPVPSCSYSTPGPSCSSSTSGLTCSSSTVDPPCSTSTSIPSCSSSIPGPSCSSLTPGPSCSYSTPGPSCSSLTPVPPEDDDCIIMPPPPKTERKRRNILNINDIIPGSLKIKVTPALLRKLSNVDVYSIPQRWVTSTLKKRKKDIQNHWKTESAPPSKASSEDEESDDDEDEPEPEFSGFNEDGSTEDTNNPGTSGISRNVPGTTNTNRNVPETDVTGETALETSDTNTILQDTSIANSTTEDTTVINISIDDATVAGTTTVDLSTDDTTVTNTTVVDLSTNEVTVASTTVVDLSTDETDAEPTIAGATVDNMTVVDISTDDATSAEPSVAGATVDLTEEEIPTHMTPTSEVTKNIVIVDGERTVTRPREESDDDGFFEQSSVELDSDASRVEDATANNRAQLEKEAAWRKQLVQRINEAQARGPVDLQKMAKTVLERTAPSATCQQLLSTAETQYDVSRLLLATLSLANSGNIEIVPSAPLTLNSFSINVLTTDESLYAGVGEELISQLAPR